MCVHSSSTYYKNHWWLTRIKYHELLAPFFSSISCFRFRCHQQIWCVGLRAPFSPTSLLFLKIIFILKTSVDFSSRCNSSWWTYYHAETPLHWLVRNWTPNVLVGWTFYSILLVDWGVKFIDPLSCFLTRTRCRKWLYYSSGNRMRSLGSIRTVCLLSL